MVFKRIKFFALLMLMMSFVLTMAACDILGDVLEMREMEVRVVGDGEVNVSEGTSRYFNDTRVTIEAIPYGGSEFDSWSGDVENRRENPTIVVMDSDKRIIPIFRPEGKALGIVLVSDVSGSMEGLMNKQINSLRSFVSRRMNHNYDKVGLFEFATGVNKLLDFGRVNRDYNNSGKWDVIEEIERLSAGGRTALWDATIAGINMASNVHSSDNITMYVLVFTDGEDNESFANKQDVINKAWSEGIPVFIVGLDPRPDYEYNPDDLKEVAEKSGGTFYDTSEEEELEELYHDIYTAVHEYYN